MTEPITLVDAIASTIEQQEEARADAPYDPRDAALAAGVARELRKGQGGAR